MPQEDTKFLGLEANVRGKDVVAALSPSVAARHVAALGTGGRGSSVLAARTQVLLRPWLLTVPGAGGRGSQEEQRKHRLNNQEKKINCAEWQLVFKERAV